MKKIYIKPAVEVIVLRMEQQLLTGTPNGGHGGGPNPGDTPAEPESAKFHAVGYDALWQSDDETEDTWDSFETKK